MGKGKRKSIAKRNKAAREFKGYVKIYARETCGCCDTAMWFSSIESAAKAFYESRLDSFASITDDKGVVHEGVDTFYGFSTDEKEFEGRSLGYLMGMIVTR